MIEVTCGCPALRKLPESAAGRKFRCPKCSQQIQLACAETLTDDAGLGDFDAQLTIVAGPENVGMRILLGGVADLSIGKLPERDIALPGVRVSREHCRLVRINFGPSIWKIVDNKSANGLLVNGKRIEEQELRDGDTIAIGEYELRFDYGPAADALPATAAPRRGAAAGSAAPTATAAALTGGPSCPCCEKSLAPGTKICVECGIKIDTGRPILTLGHVDLNSLYEGARQLIWIVSLLVWVTPLPMPIRSEAFGTRKPYAIWTIAIITILSSLAFYIAQHTGDPDSGNPPGTNLMLWPPSQPRENAVVPNSTDTKIVHRVALQLTPELREKLREKFDPDGRLSDDELVRRALTSQQRPHPTGEFHWYQLLTCAFLHDPSGIFAFIMHLGGNLLFMLVFGTRVNALIGNIATAIVYPILALCSAGVYVLMLGNGPPHPMLGASGAIMGLAGMYLILFPLHRVFCAMWVSIWLVFRRIWGYKIFPMRGFWLLAIYFGYDIVMNLINTQLLGSRNGGGVAHWAHIGGFTTGMILGLALLFSRLFNTHGGDLLSVTLGRYAWPLIGKPNRWNTPSAAAGFAS